MPRFVRLPRFPLDFDRAWLRWISPGPGYVGFRRPRFRCDFVWQVSLDHGRTRAPQPRRRSRAQLSERRSAISPRRVSRKTAALRRQSCGTEGTRVLDLRPRSHCRAGLSFAADARAYSELGSHAKTGLRARRAPRIGRRAPTANEAAPRDRAAIARRIGAPAEKRARAAAARRRGWLQSALREPEHRPRSRGHRA